MTFEELRIDKAEDFPELAEGKKVSWTVEYGKTVKTITDPKGTTIRSIKAEIETSRGGVNPALICGNSTTLFLGTMNSPSSLLRSS